MLIEHGANPGTEIVSATPAPLFKVYVLEINTLYVDPYGKGYTDIVDSMNRAGETIIVGTKPENV